jgi:hypothetical protein
MRRPRTTALVAVVALAATTILASAGAQAQEDEPPTATEVGVTDTTIRIAVIADVDNAARPGLFQGVVDGMRGFVKYINNNGGLAGRQVELDFIDSRLSADEARSALIQACEEDFALVGTSALFLSNVDPMVSCVDQAGAATGLPDVPILQTEPNHQCSPVSYSIIPPTLDCETADRPEETYRVGMEHTRYLLKQNPDLHGLWIIPGDLTSTVNTTLPQIAATEKVGVTTDDEFRLSGLSSQAEYTPAAQSINQNQSTYAANGLDYKGMVFLRREAAIQGVNSVDVWSCTLQCYDRRLLEEGGDDVEDTYVSLFFPPVEEAKQNKAINAFVKNTGKDQADGFGAQSFAAGLFFRDVVNAVVDADGNNGLTRAAFLEQAADIHDFTATVNGDDMLGPTDVGGRVPSACTVLLQVQDGKFKRIFPKEKGTVECGKPVKVKLDLIN